MKTYRNPGAGGGPADVKTITIIEAITQALHEEMERRRGSS